MASECSTAFLVTFVISTDAQIHLGDVSVALRPGFQTIYAWQVGFTYVSGDPQATGFRLNSADGLTGTFTPNTPQIGESSTTVLSGILEGTVQVVAEQDITYTGTITILQA